MIFYAKRFTRGQDGRNSITYCDTAWLV